jgi:hypothetical protein
LSEQPKVDCRALSITRLEGSRLLFGGGRGVLWSPKSPADHITLTVRNVEERGQFKLSTNAPRHERL